MSVDYFFWLDQIQPCHRDRVGSKAFYLALLQQRGYPVFPGLVLSSDLFQAFLNQIEWTDPTFADLPASSLYMDVDNPRQLQRVAQQIRQAIVSTAIPESWLLPLKLAIQDWQADQYADTTILRPSFSLAPGFDPYVSYHTRGLLEAKICRAESESIAHALKLVWAELFRARSLFYWQRLGIQPQQVQLAVLIQPIRSAIASGEILNRGDELEVQAVWGLGHGMRQGSTSDRYRVDAAGTIHLDTISRKSVAYHIGVANLGAENREVEDRGVPGNAAPDRTATDRTATDRTASDRTTSDRTTSEQSIQHRSSLGEIEQDDCLQMLILKPEEQTQPVLTQSQIERLAQLNHQLMLVLDLPVELEWVLCPAPGSNIEAAGSEAQGLEPDFYITQVIPYSTHTPRTASAPVLPELELAEGAQVHPKNSRLDGNRLKGIAAAPGKVTSTVWVMPSRTAPFREMPPDCILVAPMILPEWISHMRQIAGIITEQGGTTSHGAILARELSIPAVVGVADAMQDLRTGETVLLNGDRGEVTRMVEEPDTASHPEKNPADDRHLPTIDAPTAQPLPPESLSDRASQVPQVSRTMPTTATRLMVSISQTESIAQTRNKAIDGVGLLRSELLWLRSLDDRSPEAWLQEDQSRLIERLAQQIQPFADAMMPRPLFYRSLDVRTHEFPALAPPQVERNPTLGLRGTYCYQINPVWFEVELAALRHLQQSGYDNLRLILPFVRTVEEFIFCRDRVDQAGLRQSGFELWIMAEVPSVLLLLSAYIEAGVQGMAIGCNDLTQLLLGVDRDHPQMATQFNMTHPAVMQTIQQIVQTCRTAGLPCTVCGHLPKQLDVIDQLVKWGVSGISVEPGDLDWMSEAIDRAERKLILERVRQINP